jgi:DNA polymerase-3 subunit gamma/tau
MDGIEVGDDALRLVARDAEGSMRDAQSKLDQVIAFTGTTITAADVAAVLGLVGRDLLIDAVEAVANENAPAAFDLAARAVEMGYDLRAVCRELTRTVRDLMVLSVDPSRVDDPEIAGEGDRERLTALVKRFSREDLLRAFDLLAALKTTSACRAAALPPRDGAAAVDSPAKLVPIEDLIAELRTRRHPFRHRCPPVVAEARPARKIQAMASAAASRGGRAAARPSRRDQAGGRSRA